MPSVDVLQQFHNAVSPMFNRMRYLSNESIQLSEIRDTLLPKLMSGELKINDLNC